MRSWQAHQMKAYDYRFQKPIALLTMGDIPSPQIALKSPISQHFQRYLGENQGFFEEKFEKSPQKVQQLSCEAGKPIK